MRIKRAGKCKKCKAPTTETRVFAERVSLFDDPFNPIPAGTIDKDLTDQIRAWRKKPIYCDKHKPRRRV